MPDDPQGAWDFGLGAGFYVNATQSPWDQHYQMGDYVTNELPSLIEQNFSVDADRRSISGHSMGGHGALTIALRNTDKYRSVSAFAPIVSPLNCPWGVKALSNYIGEDKAQWRQYDACELVRNGAQLPMLVDQGLGDGFLEEQLKTHLLEGFLRRYVTKMVMITRTSLLVALSKSILCFTKNICQFRGQENVEAKK